MSRKISSATPQEKLFAKRAIIVGILAWVLALPVSFYLLIVASATGDSLSEPTEPRHFLVGITLGVLVLLGSAFWVGITTLAMDWEVRSHIKKYGPQEKMPATPPSTFMALTAIANIVGGVALTVHYFNFRYILLEILGAIIVIVTVNYTGGFEQFKKS